MSDPKYSKALQRLQNVADTLIDIYTKKYGKKIPKVTLRFANLIFCAGEYDPKTNLISLNRMYFDKFGFDRIEKVLRHEVAHAITAAVCQEYDHGDNFKLINDQVDGSKTDTLDEQ